MTQQFLKLMAGAMEIDRVFSSILTTPHEITTDVMEFAAEIVPKEEPLFVTVEKVGGMKAQNCHGNVANQVRQRKGAIVQGWKFWTIPSLVVTANYHAVWQQPDGKLLCITPQQETSILFVPDQKSLFDVNNPPTHAIPNRYKALMDHPDVHEWIRLRERNAKFIAIGKNRMPTAEVQQAWLEETAYAERLVRMYAEMHRQ